MIYQVYGVEQQSEPDRKPTHSKGARMARSIGSTNETALAACITAKAEIDRLLAELATLSVDHFHATPDQITRGRVGTVIRDDIPMGWTEQARLFQIG